jgi:hypothetical protein
VALVTVTCTSASLCAAVDGVGNVLVSNVRIAPPRGTATHHESLFFRANLPGPLHCALTSQQVTAPPVPAQYHHCTSPQSFGHLAPGTYTFWVQGRDRQGLADPLPARRSFTISSHHPGRLTNHHQLASRQHGPQRSSLRRTRPPACRQSAQPTDSPPAPPAQ